MSPHQSHRDPVITGRQIMEAEVGGCGCYAWPIVNAVTQVRLFFRSSIATISQVTRFDQAHPVNLDVHGGASCQCLCRWNQFCFKLGNRVACGNNGGLLRWLGLPQVDTKQKAAEDRNGHKNPEIGYSHFKSPPKRVQQLPCQRIFYKSVA